VGCGVEMPGRLMAGQLHEAPPQTHHQGQGRPGQARAGRVGPSPATFTGIGPTLPVSRQRISAAELSSMRMPVIATDASVTEVGTKLSRW